MYFYMIEKDTVPNSLIHTDVIEETGIFLPLKNSLRFYNGLKSKYEFKVKKGNFSKLTKTFQL